MASTPLPTLHPQTTLPRALCQRVRPIGGPGGSWSRNEARVPPPPPISFSPLSLSPSSPFSFAAKHLHSFQHGSVPDRAANAHRSPLPGQAPCQVPSTLDSCYLTESSPQPCRIRQDSDLNSEHQICVPRLEAALDCRWAAAIATWGRVSGGLLPALPTNPEATEGRTEGSTVGGSGLTRLSSSGLEEKRGLSERTWEEERGQGGHAPSPTCPLPGGPDARRTGCPPAWQRL